MSDALTKRQMRAKLNVGTMMSADEIRVVDAARTRTQESRAEFLRRSALEAARVVLTTTPPVAA